MASLSAHLRRPYEHGRLAFHPECPLCTEARLAGTLASTAFVGRRTQALLASGVLAVATAMPGAALAADPEPELDVTTAPEQVGAGAPPGDADFDPGGESADLPIDAGPAPETPDSLEADEDLGVGERPPVTDNIAPDAAADLDEQPTPPTTAAPPVPPVAVSPTPTTTPPSGLVAPETPATAPAEAETEATAAPRQDVAALPQAQKQQREKKKTPRAAESPPPARAILAQPPQPINAPVTAPPTVQVAQAQPAPTSTATTRSHGAQRGDRVHVVQRNESLWSIASDVLGGDSSPARIAREVNRLWELNSARIGTGDRDLLMAGTRLELR